ncbi:MAG: VOC family protein, partial [Chitinispirillia bacterium]|nr:VOC family protein [Chitinispirillia bacterium]
KEGGNVGMELQKTFYSELYGMVTDKFGVTWQILHSSGQW